MFAGVIDLNVSDAIATITLNRPTKRNALRAEDFRDLAAAFNDANDNPLVKVVILTGTETSFCAGADLTESEISDVYGHIVAIHRCANSLALLAKPSIAAVNGAAVGAGMALALGCDLVLAADSAMMSEVFLDRGLTLDFGTSAALLARLGPHVAKQLAFFGEKLTGERLLALGLVNEVIPASLLTETVQHWATMLASRPPQALAATKSLLDSRTRSFGDVLTLEQIAQGSVIPLVPTAAWQTSFGEKNG